MFAGLLFTLILSAPLHHHYQADPMDNTTPIFPAFARPQAVGGWLPPPGPPSNGFVGTILAGTGRRPGDVIVSHRLVKETVHEPRHFPTVGQASLWSLQYECILIGPDGPYGVYTDRTALILVP